MADPTPLDVNGSTNNRSVFANFVNYIQTVLHFRSYSFTRAFHGNMFADNSLDKAARERVRY